MQPGSAHTLSLSPKENKYTRWQSSSNKLHHLRHSQYQKSLLSGALTCVERGRMEKLSKIVD